MSFVYLLEMFGTAAFAVSGALAASRKRMDIFGFCVLALMTAVGGGTIRDVIIDRTPVFWIGDGRFVIVVIIAALIVFFAPYRQPGWRRRWILWTDAMGLSVLAALGTEICLQHAAGPLVAILLGVTSGIVGGIVRDVICNEMPLILSREVYATAAFAASAAYVAAAAAGLSANASLGVGVVIGFAVRALAIRYGWSLPSFGARNP